MLQTEDLKRRVWAEIEQLPADELERVYQLILLVKDEFIDVSGEERYLTERWRQAEREATEAYRREVGCRRTTLWMRWLTLSWQILTSETRPVSSKTTSRLTPFVTEPFSPIPAPPRLLQAEHPRTRTSPGGGISRGC